MLENIDFADDKALLSSTMNHHQFQTIKLNDKSAKGGMKVKCLVLQSGEAKQQEWSQSDSRKREEWTLHKCHLNGGGTTDIKRRKLMIDVSFRRLANIMKATGISRKSPS